VTDPHRLLLLGGTTEARQLAEALAGEDDLVVVTSLAGRTSSPSQAPGQQRTGGFGGARGLAQYLRTARISALVDATHPFAPVMRWHAEAACAATGVPRLRLERPAWVPGPGDRWTTVASLAEAAAEIASGSSQRVFLTVGRSDLDCFVPACDGRRRWLVRSIEPPGELPLHPAEAVCARGPFSLEAELALLSGHRIDLLVTKNSGGEATVAKLEAARLLGLPVLVVDRPPSPGGPVATTVADALEWLRATLSRYAPGGVEAPG
jgi:precorrin-6A/cobalt-precorrin-6A reductase